MFIKRRDNCGGHIDKKIKVLFLTTSFPLTEDSASGVFTLRLIENFPPEIDVTVLTPGYTRELKFQENKKYKLNCFRYAPRPWQLIAHQPGGIPVAFKKHHGLFLLLPLFILSMFIYCFRLSRNIDIIHANWSTNGVISGIAGLLTNTPVVTTLRGADVERIQNSAIDRYILRLCMKMNNKVITVNNAIHAHVKKYYPLLSHKLVTIPNGVGKDFLEISLHRSEKKGKKVRFATIGSLIPRKGLNIVIQALSKLKNLENIELVIIGEGQEKETLKSLTLQLGLSDYVRFLGNVPPSYIPGELANTDVFVLTSFSEGRPNVVLEAMAAGVPVIASNIDGVNELIQDDETGLLFDPGDVECLAIQMERLINDHEMRARLGEAGRNYIIQNGLTWEKTAQNYIGVYKEIIQSK